MKSLLPVWLILTVLLKGCGGGEGNTQPSPPPLAVVPPVITLSVNSLILYESASAVFTVSAVDYLSNTISAQLSCNIGTLTDNVFTPPNVVVTTTVVCTATATDSGNRTSTRSLTLTINPVIPVLALANGANVATSAALTIFDISFAEIPEGLIDAQLNDEPVKLGVTSDNQLVFFPPLDASGTQTLVVELEGQSVSYQFTQQPVQILITDTAAYLTDYLLQLQQEVDEQITLAQANGLSSTEIQELMLIRDSFDPAVIAGLTAEEAELLAYLVSQNFSGLFSEAEVVSAASYMRTGDIFSDQDIEECRRTASRIGLSSTTAFLSTYALLAEASTTPASLPAVGFTLITAAVSWNILKKSLKRIDTCYRWASTMLDSLTQNLSLSNANSQRFFSNKQTGAVLSNPIINTKSVNDPVDFFHNETKTFSAIRRYQILDGAESAMNDIVSAINKVRRPVVMLVNLIGEENIPDFMLDFAAKEVELEDFLTLAIDPSSLSISAISTTDVTGDFVAKNDSFDITFVMADLDSSVIPFQFSLSDAKVENGVTVIDAEVTLNPPVAYDLTYSVVIGSELLGQLEADFETDFVIKSQPANGTVELLSEAEQHGVFRYIPNAGITGATSDSFTYLATNGSASNGGESNLANVTIEIVPANRVQLISAVLTPRCTPTPSSEPYSGAFFDESGTVIAPGYCQVRWYSSLSSQFISSPRFFLTAIGMTSNEGNTLGITSYPLLSLTLTLQQSLPAPMLNVAAMRAYRASSFETAPPLPAVEMSPYSVVIFCRTSSSGAAIPDVYLINGGVNPAFFTCQSIGSSDQIERRMIIGEQVNGNQVLIDWRFNPSNNVLPDDYEVYIGVVRQIGGADRQVDGSFWQRPWVYFPPEDGPGQFELSNMVRVQLP